MEAQRSLPREQRQKFLLMRTFDGTHIGHPGWPRDERKVYSGDFEELVRQGLLSLSFGSRGTPSYDITSAGYHHYEAVMHRHGEATERVEAENRRYLDTDYFRSTYPAAYRRWSEAEAMLWGCDSESQLTTIGHLCREAIQEFATALVDRHQPPDANPDKAKDINRIKAVLDQRGQHFGERERQFLDALLAYWRAVSGLVQRQEHGSQPQAAPLLWEDGRRVVFQCAVVMFEIDRALSRRS